MNDAPAEPRDLGLEWQSTLAFGVLMLMVSALFIHDLSWWRPLLWAGIYNGLLWWRRKHLLKTEREAPQALRSAKRLSHWICSAWCGSAAWWLFIPAAPLMHGALVFGLLCVITSIVLECVGDSVRVAVSLALVMAPTAIRFCFEPAPISIVLGVGGFVAGPVWWQLWRRQQRVWREQFDLRQRAEQAARLLAETTLAKARFFAAANHDLRQPVHAIGLYLSALQRQPLEADGRDALQGIQNAWQALSDQLAQLMDLSRADSGALQVRPENLDLDALLRQQLRQHRLAAAARQQRLVILGEGPHVALADALMLGRVLDNLCSNAIKFSPPGACIALAVRRGERQDWRVQVRDNGPGIPAEEQARIFDEFVQIGNPQRDRNAGFGLGLAIARRFMEAMQGSISVYSGASPGTVFELRLPRAPEQAAPVLPDLAPEPAALASLPDDLPPIRRLLLIDDDEMVVDATRTLAARWSIPFSVADSTDAALRIARAGDIALCDIRLPGGQSGIETACRLRDRGLRVALISGEMSLETLGLASQLGLDILLKPARPAELHALLARLAGSGRPEDH